MRTLARIAVTAAAVGSMLASSVLPAFAAIPDKGIEHRAEALGKRAEKVEQRADALKGRAADMQKKAEALKAEAAKKAAHADELKKAAAAKAEAEKNAGVKFELTGKVTAVDITGGKLSVEVKTIDGRGLREFRRQTVVIAIAVDAKFTKRNVKGAGLKDFAVGDRVLVRGMVKDKAFSGGHVVALGAAKGPVDAKKADEKKVEEKK